jgi:hypothetical protein
MPRLRRPVFLLAFAGGGSNIVWNLLQSHPALCSPIRETDELFGLGTRGRARVVVARALGASPGFFDRADLTPRAPLEPAAAWWVDRGLARARDRTLRDRVNRQVAPGRPYRRSELRDTRLVAKQLDGLVLAARALHRLYPDACFVALQRDGLALLESALRRNPGREASAQLALQRRVGEAMLADRRALPRYTLLSFEDLLRDPAAFLARLYAAVELDWDPGRPLRLKAREHWRPDGGRGAPWTLGEKRWLGLEELPALLEPTVGALHAERLSDELREHHARVMGDLPARLDAALAEDRR